MPQVNMQRPRFRVPRAQFIILLALCCAWLASCFESESRPHFKEASEEETAVYTEVLIIEAILQDFAGADRDSLSERFYDELYDRYGTDQDALDELRTQYSLHPELWLSVGDRVRSYYDSARAAPDSLLNGRLMLPD